VKPKALFAVTRDAMRIAAEDSFMVADILIDS
jgi:hypothetical protein